MRLLAAAKVNLHLRVGPPRPDGFHPLLSWMCAVGLYDALNIEPAASAGVLLSCDRADLPCDQSNLIVKAANALAEAAAATSTAPLGARIRLEKRIPMGAGLGGGSSDGARALLGLNQLWKVNWPMERLAALAARIGSDLPFFFHGPSSVCSGRGEIVRPIAPPSPHWAVLVLPELAMPTPAVYRRFDELKLGEETNVRDEPVWEDWASLGAQSLLPELVNDLEPAAFSISPALAQLRDQCEQTLRRIVRMSGSGSSLFTLFDAEPEAHSAAQLLHSRLNTPTLAAPHAPPIHDDLQTC
jgi:4-diphosphocytidyl-2-C-methyl-D-erythritol kinase